MNKGFKIALVGPPHSGKSVFRSFLENSLPYNITKTVISAPDGEGKYSNRENQNEVQAFRVKGKYSKELVENITQVLDEIENKIVIVDTGGKLENGRLTKENKEIFKHCTHAIVLSSDNNLKKTWEKECKKMDLDIIASLDSSLEGNDEQYYNSVDITEPIRGKVTQLNRGEEKKPSLLLSDILEKILSIAKEKNIIRPKQQSKNIYSPDVISMRFIGEAMGLPKKENGYIIWDFNKLPQIMEMFEKELERFEDKNEAKIYTSNPNWLTFAITEKAHEKGFKDVKIFNSKIHDFQEIPIIKQHDNKTFKEINGNIREYSIAPEDKAKLLLFETANEAYLNIYSKKGTNFSLEELKELNLPHIDTDKDLYLSYLTDNYFLVNTISSSYLNIEKNVADIGNGFITYKSPFNSDLGKQKQFSNSFNHIGILNKLKGIYEEREKVIQGEFEEKERKKVYKGRQDNFDKNKFRQEHIVKNPENESRY